MKKRLFITAISIFCIALSHAADVKLPPTCTAFMPEVLLKYKVLPATEAEKLANSKTFGQDVIPQGEKRYWDVYSDRENNKVYPEPRKNTQPLGKRLKLGEKLRIAKIENGFALVYSEPKVASKYPTISDAAVHEAIGWVPMENLLLWSTCPANENDIYNKALITLNMDEIGRQKSDKYGILYGNPDLSSSRRVNTGMTFYFIMKQHPNGMVLLATECSLDNAVGKQTLYGWVDTKTYVPWSQRSCIEPNWEAEAIAKLNGKTVEVTSSNNLVICDYKFGGEGFVNQYGPDKYRMPETVLRYPILNNDSGDDSQFKCTVFARLGQTLNQQMAKYNETVIKQRKALDDMSKLNMIFVIDGTRSMGKYFSAVKDAIKKGCEYLISDSENNKYTPKVGLVIYRDYADGEQGLVEYVPMSDVNDVRLIEYLDNVGKYGAKSSSADRTNEEALYKGLEYALDAEKMGYKKEESNLMMVIGDCGNDEKDNQCLSYDEIKSKLVENRINLMVFQVRRNNDSAWKLFNNQMRKFLLDNVQTQYEQLISGIKTVWEKDADGFDVKPGISDSQFFIGSIRYAGMGVDMEVSKLTSLMERSIGLFAKAIDNQRATLTDIGHTSDVSDDNRKISEAFAISILGEEGYKSMKDARSFTAATGYTKKTAPEGHDYWKSVIFISEEELISLMDRLTPVNNKANTGNRKEYVVALKNLVRSMLPDITEEEMAMKGTGEIMALITGLNVKSAALDGPRLVDIQDPTVVSEAKFRSLVQNFRDKYRNLRGIREDKNYKYVYKGDGALYYWIPVEQLP